MTASPQDSFTEFVLDQLSGLRGLTCRPMFGGFGLYQGAVFFGLIHQGRAYLKVTADSLSRYQAHGMGAFQPKADQTLTRYYEVPPEVLEDSTTFIRWAEEAITSAGTVRVIRAAVQRTS
jgi:DNA transformation protein and related proteins